MAATVLAAKIFRVIPQRVRSRGMQAKEFGKKLMGWQ